MQQLQYLNLNNNAFTGGLPESWGNNKSFPKLMFANLVSGLSCMFHLIYYLTMNINDIASGGELP